MMPTPSSGTMAVAEMGSSYPLTLHIMKMLHVTSRACGDFLVDDDFSGVGEILAKNGSLRWMSF